MNHREPGAPKQTKPTLDERLARERENSLEDRQEVARKLIREIDTLLGDTDADHDWKTFAAADTYAGTPPGRISRMSHLYAGREELEDGSTL